MIPLLILSFALTAAIALTTVWFLFKLTRVRFTDFIEYEIEEMVKSLLGLSLATHDCSLAFMAFSEATKKVLDNREILETK